MTVPAAAAGTPRQDGPSAMPDGARGLAAGAPLPTSDQPGIAARRPARVLAMIPSGEVYDHDCVRWYEHQDIQQHIGNYHNIGDAFVFDSSLKLMNFEVSKHLNIRNATAADIDRYNAEFDFCFLRGSNYIHADMDWENAIPVLERLKMPILAFGIGAQAPAKGKLVLSDSTKRVLRIIAEKSASIGVRGNFSAEVLWDLGIKNVRVIGCPTLFRNNDPDLRIDLPPLDQIRRVGFTLRREVSRSYAQDMQHYLALQRRTLLALAQRYDVEIMAQGEIEEKKMLWGTADQRQEAVQALLDQGWFEAADDPLIGLYRAKLFYSDVVAEYEALVRRRDLVLGYRLHGNLMALANAVPSIYFTYDSRTSEFVETFGIPSFDVFSRTEFDIEEYWDQGRFERFNRLYRRGYGEIRSFLDENAIDHKMHYDPPNALVRRRV